MNNILKHDNIHFIGIGGIGSSGLARFMLYMGKDITGSDLVTSDIIKNLEKLGAKIFIGKHKADNVNKDVDLLVYSNAVKKSNPEYKKAVSKKIKSLSYPQFLGKIISSYIPIVVSGTHGKSTVTAMLAHIFIAAGFDPNVIVGAKVNDFEDNLRFGLGKHFILEGDEYKEAFLNYNPVGLIINNIEADHLDHYKNEQNIVTAFKKLAGKVPKGGLIVANVNDDNVVQAITGCKCKVIKYGIDYGDFYASHIVRHGELTRFAVKGLDKFDLAIRVPGEHNVLNALAATVMALSFGISIDKIKKGLLNYQGIWRRFEIRGKRNGAIIIDDYAHHPTEIKATLKTARNYFPNKKIWCVFQPHSIDRTKQLFDDFVKSFSDCDKLILTDIYEVAGRDKKDKFSSKKLFDKVKKINKNTYYIRTFLEIEKFLASKIKQDEIVITMGAGDITEVSNMLIK